MHLLIIGGALADGLGRLDMEKLAQHAADLANAPIVLAVEGPSAHHKGVTLMVTPRGGVARPPSAAQRAC